MDNSHAEGFAGMKTRFVKVVKHLRWRPMEASALIYVLI